MNDCTIKHYPNNASYCSVCDVTGARWCLHANHNSFHGVVPPKPDGSRWLTLWSLDECLEVCADDPRCSAADFDMDTRTCYVHRDPDFADTRGPYPQVHQFVVRQRCRTGDHCYTWSRLNTISRICQT